MCRRYLLARIESSLEKKLQILCKFPFLYIVCNISRETWHLRAHEKKCGEAYTHKSKFAHDVSMIV